MNVLSDRVMRAPWTSEAGAIARGALASLVTLVALGALAGCSATAATPPPPPPCDLACQDDKAVHALREMLKLAFNYTLQGKPVGAHDESTDCPMGGKVRVAGTASSNALQGATEVDLVVTFDACRYLQKGDDPEENYDMTVTGVISEKGTLAVQPSATSAVTFKSDAVTLSGEVYDPAIPYTAEACPLELGQNGSRIDGLLCGRKVTADL